MQGEKEVVGESTDPSPDEERWEYVGDDGRAAIYRPVGRPELASDDLHLRNLLGQIESYHRDEKQRWAAWRAEDQASLTEALKERDEARSVAQEYLQGLWDEFPNTMQWKKDAIAKEIADHPWLMNAHVRPWTK